MKTYIAKLLLSATFLLFGFSLMAQIPPHPPGHNQTTNQPIVPAGAPVGSGTALLLVLGAAYGAKKTYEARQEDDK